MNSGLSPSDPTLVAAFRSALLHQGAIALLVLAFLWLLWATARTWRPAAPPAMGRAVTAEPRGRWLLRTGFGVLWIFDGILQAQPRMAGGLATQVIEPTAASSPGWVQHLVNWGGTAWSYHPVQAAAAAVFTDAGGTWRSAGLALPAGGRVRVLGLTSLAGGNMALLAAGNNQYAAWWDGTRWTVSAPVTAGGVRAAGFGPGGSAWLLLAGGRATIVSGAAGSTWRALPPVPAGTEVLVPPATGRFAPGTGGSYDALAVAGSRLTVWRLAQGAWAKVQQIAVPVQYGSSG
jgi:hypothetical protein